MIRHIVCFKFKEENKSENIIRAKEMLDALPAKIPQILHSETYVDCGIKGENYDLILISDFACHKDLEDYILHPDHLLWYPCEKAEVV